MQNRVDETLTAGETKQIHKFELAGLGLAPFSYLGMEVKQIVYPDGSSQPSGTCDYCGTGIKYCFRVQSADGKQFVTGCDCIRKIGDTCLIRLISKDERKMLDMKNAQAKVAKNKRLEKRGQEAKEYCLEMVRTNNGLLASLPHPSEYQKNNGKTLADYAAWMIENGYCVKLAVVIKTALKS